MKCWCPRCLFIAKMKHANVLQVDPQNGTVGFGSGLHGWAFTLKDFAKMYCKKFKIEEPKMMKRLWGDNFYNEAEKKWTKSEGQGTSAEKDRGFNKYVLTPIYHVRNILTYRQYINLIMLR